jgi:CRISPR-associated protein Cas1
MLLLEPFSFSFKGEKKKMKTKTVKIALESFGSHLGMEKGCFVVKDRNGMTERYPLFENEIAEVQIKSGNSISSGALASLGFWGIDLLILTQKGNPVAMLRSLDDDSHVQTRISQYEALNNGKGLEIAKQIVLAKLQGQDQLLKKYGLRSLDTFSYQQQIKAIEGDLKLMRARLMNVEGHFSRQYFNQVFKLFNESIRPEGRKTFKAYDGLNNILNLAYQVLSWKIHLALLKAKLEPYLGFLHALQSGMPSLICDFQELYRYLIDDFVIGFCRSISQKDFILKSEGYSGSRKGKRQYLKEPKTRELTDQLNRFFEFQVNIPRIKRGQKQEIETLISEEALLLAEYLRNEKEIWKPRVASLDEKFVQKSFMLVTQC